MHKNRRGNISGSRNRKQKALQRRAGEADAKPLDEMKVEELKVYAAEHNIDLGDAAKKADILKAIQEAEAKE